MGNGLFHQASYNFHLAARSHHFIFRIHGVHDEFYNDFRFLFDEVAPGQKLVESTEGLVLYDCFRQMRRIAMMTVFYFAFALAAYPAAVSLEQLMTPSYVHPPRELIIYFLFPTTVPH